MRRRRFRQLPAEQLDRFLKQEERRVLGRGSNSGTGRLLNGRRGNLKPTNDVHGVVQIKFNPPPELGNHEIYWGQKTDTQVRMVEKIRGAISIPRRHGHDGPSRNILREISRYSFVCQKRDERVERAG